MSDGHHFYRLVECKTICCIEDEMPCADNRQRIQALLNLRFKFEFGEVLVRLEHDGCDQWYSQRWYELANGQHEMLGKLRHFFKSAISIVLTKINVPIFAVPAQRNRTAKLDGGITEPIPAVANFQAHDIENKPAGIAQRASFPGLLRLARTLNKQGAIFEYAIVIDTHRYKDNVALALRIESPNHIIDQAKFRPT
jgi:hypothetical protein